MSFTLSEIGRVGQAVDVLRGGDVGPDGRLLTYYEIRAALRIQPAGRAADHPADPVPQPASSPSASVPALPDHLQLVWDRTQEILQHGARPWDSDTLRQVENDYRALRAGGVRPPPLPHQGASQQPCQFLAASPLPVSTPEIRREPDLAQPQQVEDQVQVPSPDFCCPVCEVDV